MNARFSHIIIWCGLLVCCSANQIFATRMRGDSVVLHATVVSSSGILHASFCSCTMNCMHTSAPPSGLSCSANESRMQLRFSAKGPPVLLEHSVSLAMSHGSSQYLMPTGAEPPSGAST